MDCISPDESLTHPLNHHRWSGRGGDGDGVVEGKGEGIIPGRGFLSIPLSLSYPANKVDREIDRENRNERDR